VDGESVYLKIHLGGAELGATLLRSCTQIQLRNALRIGFTSALTHDAGLAQAPDGRALLLTQWLPGVRSWPEAAGALENLLNQLALWRAALAPPDAARPLPSVDRNERHLRTLLAGAKR